MQPGWERRPRTGLTSHHAIAPPVVDEVIDVVEVVDMIDVVVVVVTIVIVIGVFVRDFIAIFSEAHIYFRRK